MYLPSSDIFTQFPLHRKTLLCIQLIYFFASKFFSHSILYLYALAENLIHNSVQLQMVSAIKTDSQLLFCLVHLYWLVIFRPEKVVENIHCFKFVNRSINTYFPFFGSKHGIITLCLNITLDVLTYNLVLYSAKHKCEANEKKIQKKLNAKKE